MTELKPRIHDESNGLDYVLVGDYYVPDLKLPECFFSEFSLSFLYYFLFTYIIHVFRYNFKLL